MIVDDEREAHYVLVNYLNRNPEFILRGQCYDASTALSLLSTDHIDLIFLDINMPGIDGFAMLSELANPPKVIFTTAYLDFALKAFDVGAIDYLVKPIPYARFEQSLNRYKELQVAHAETTEVPVSISLKTDNGMMEYPIEEIYYVQSWGNYVKVFFEDYYELCSATTTEIERLLPNELFCRIHKSYIVSLKQIALVKANQLFVNNYLDSLPIGITYKRRLLEQINPKNGTND